ncbi:MAG TPA: hypothetical protein ENG10_00580 [Candidatus Bathyarchaeota archaeon]|nr:hypothetical protein [Candidatus Bathyarchaeota archaeon]HEX68777.1 hypothetical protein [Candidatus Bathyarchaeota archaeon]
MSFRKKRRSLTDEFLGDSLLGNMDRFFDGFPESGYSISVVQTPEGTKVRAKVGKDTDVDMLKRQLQQQYPNAEIEIEGGRKEPLIREISTKSLKKENEENENHD